MKWLVLAVLGFQFLVAPLCVAEARCDEHPGHTDTQEADHQHASASVDSSRLQPCAECDEALDEGLALTSHMTSDMASVSDCPDYEGGLFILAAKIEPSKASISDGIDFAYAPLDPPDDYWHPVPLSLPHSQIYQRTLRIRL